MWRRTAGLFTGFALALAGPVLAKEVFTAGQAMEDTPMARVVTLDRLPHECLAPVAISRIDGESRAVPAQGFLIEAGLHRINGRAVLDMAKCRPLETDQRIPPAADLAMDFKAGHVYYIAYDRSHTDSTEWRLVVWKVEQISADGSADSLLTNPDSVQ